MIPGAKCRPLNSAGLSRPMNAQGYQICPRMFATLPYQTVSVISRDRSGLYAEGAALGAPSAQQVADRFHLLLNLSAAIERALEERSSQFATSRRGDGQPA